MDPALAALIEQIKVQLVDGLKDLSCLDPDTGNTFWTREQVKKALTASIPKTGISSYKIGMPFQPTYEQYVDFIKERFETARGRLEHAAKFDPDDWEEALEEFDFQCGSYRRAVIAMLKQGAHTKVPGMMIGDIKINPVNPAEIIEIQFVVEGEEEDPNDS